MIAALIWTGILFVVFYCMAVVVLGVAVTIIMVVFGNCFVRDPTPDEENMVRDISHALETVSDGYLDR